MEFKFQVIEPAITMYSGDLYIEAETEEDAIEKIKKMTNQEINNLIGDWKLSDDTTTSGKIEVWSSTGHQIK